MIAIAALTFACGIALAQYYMVFVLLPATILVVAGVSILEALSGHAPGRAALSVLLGASTLQMGFLAASLLSGLAAGAFRAASTASPGSK